MTGKICGTGSYVPEKILDNNNIAEMVETSDEWIRERTGIVRRHIIGEDTVVSMAAAAGRRALADGNVKAEDIDLIMVSSFSSETMLPCAACGVQERIGAINAVCFDLNAACAGFLFALNTAQAYIQAGIYKNILVIGAESLSNTVNWKDRSTCILFGDGAGAAVLKAGAETPFYMVSHSDGGKGDCLTLLSRHRKGWSEESDESYIRMDGQEVFKFAVKKVPEAVHELLEKAGLKETDIDYFILHQANRRIVEAVAKRLGVEPEKFPVNVQEYGNTSSASIPILLDELNRNGILKKGQKLVLAGFGAGLSWGASLIEW